MTSVSLLLVHSGFDNVADSYSPITPDYDTDEFRGEEIVYYDLPEGYSSLVDANGESWILDPSGDCCDVYTHPWSGHPQLKSGAGSAPVLRPSKVAA